MRRAMREVFASISAEASKRHHCRSLGHYFVGSQKENERKMALPYLSNSDITFRGVSADVMRESLSVIHRYALLHFDVSSGCNKSDCSCRWFSVRTTIIRRERFKACFWIGVQPGCTVPASNGMISKFSPQIYITCYDSIDSRLALIRIINSFLFLSHDRRKHRRYISWL